MYLDEQYIRIMGPRLPKFKAVGGGKYQCRCPLCGGSKSDKNKTSGSFYTHKGTWFYNCFKCNRPHTIPTLLQMLFPDLYDEYLMGASRDKMRAKTEKKENNSPEKIIKKTLLTEFNNIQKLSDLPADHKAVKYIAERMIPSKYMSELYYAENFKKWSNTLVPNTFQSEDYDDDRVVIPFKDKSGEIFAFQGRSIAFSKVKYLTVKIDPARQKIYGLDRVDLTRPVFVVEGPIDSMFIDNCIGSADSNLKSVLGIVKKPIFVWDNEPRSKIICKKMEQALEKGVPIVVWRKSDLFNDINDAVQNFNISIPEINRILRTRAFRGLDGLTELNNWRKTSDSIPTTNSRRSR